MLTLRIAAVGKLKERHFAEACAEYQKRLGGFCRLQMIEIPEARLPDSPSVSQIRQALAREGEQLLRAADKKDFLVALCVEGDSLTSPQLSEQLRRLQNAGHSAVCFAIGGSYGLDDAVKEAAGLRMSMSAMTFPHQLARVMLLEQLYRAFSLAAGGKYHK